MEPVVLAVFGALAVAAVVVAIARTCAERLAALADDAEPSLRELRAWRETVEQGLATAVADGRWVTRDVRLDWEARRPAPSSAALKLAERKEAGAEARDLITFVDHDLRDVVDSTNERILSDELERQRAFFDTIETKPLTDEQASAVATFDNRVQVVAAAGSGKTSVMVARAAYAIRREIVPAERILLLAFNKDAAAELQRRVDERLDAAGIDPSGLGAEELVTELFVAICVAHEDLRHGKPPYESERARVDRPTHRLQPRGSRHGLPPHPRRPASKARPARPPELAAEWAVGSG